jgi:hypothetical protein
MDTFDFWIKEWPLITQAPYIVIPGAVLVCLAGWFVARSWYAQQIETLRERLTLAQEKTVAAQDKAVALTEQIQSNNAIARPSAFPGEPDPSSVSRVNLNFEQQPESESRRETVEKRPLTVSMVPRAARLVLFGGAATIAAVIALLPAISPTSLS